MLTDYQQQPEGSKCAGMTVDKNLKGGSEWSGIVTIERGSRCPGIFEEAYFSNGGQFARNKGVSLAGMRGSE